MDKLDDMEKRDKIKNWGKNRKIWTELEKKIFPKLDKKDEIKRIIYRKCKQSNLEDQDV